MPDQATDFSGGKDSDRGCNRVLPGTLKLTLSSVKVVSVACG
ncbi:hypothetical protein BN440_3153 [Erwinia amylovora MR1]|nr:hypothetical protein BN440_3153 [Erwinia amylovora MR1]